MQATDVTERADMVTMDAGSFRMGSDHHYPEEAPSRSVDVLSFQIDASAVTNSDFSAFVRATGYMTTSEQPLDPDFDPGMPDDYYLPGALVFTMPAHPVGLSDASKWWSFVPGACWRHPEGHASTLAGRGDHPVVQVSYTDALAYARWVGKTLPSEVQWEYAAAIGEMAAGANPADLNIWHGVFPNQNERRFAPPFTVPAKSGPSQNGLYHMLGNVWEWTSDSMSTEGTRGCCGADAAASVTDTKVLKGGSFLCAETYCRRYRPAARMGYALISATNHIGFRCASAI